MSVIGKVITRHFRWPVRYQVLTKNSRLNYSISSRLKNIRYCQQHYSVPFSLIKTQQLCTTSREIEAMALSPLDPSSHSRPELAIIKHVDLKLNVDFENKQLSGIADLTINALDNINELILDSSDITIESIETEDGKSLEYRLDDPVPNYGSKLTIPLAEPATVDQKKFCTELNKTKQEEKTHEIKQVPSATTMAMSYNGYIYKPIMGSQSDNHISADSTMFLKVMQTSLNSMNVDGRVIKIRIKYKTSPTATALQWLDAKQTSGKKHPYMFSQCQPIHARSILPCQDSPAVKFTYNAEVTAPEPFTVLMSAIRGDSNSTTYTFRQPVPIPSYLLAIAVGVLESRELGPRSHVWSEKEEIERSAWEFANTEKYLQAAEKLCGPYQWSQYDLLVLPPSFPYGGMENPCLTFVTPTLLAGDRSQADVIVHEIMHSWTGNLVTNRNFEHFWLNEGFTVFLERKVGASLIEDKEEAKRSRDFSSLLGLQELDETINKNLGASNPLTQLVPDLNQTHPDDAFSRVPYEKGSLFLRYLEDLVGGPEVFDDFLRSYLNKFQRQSIDTEQFKAHLFEYFKDNEALKKVDWETWLHKSGMPPVIPAYDTSMTKAVTDLRAKISNVKTTFDYNDIMTFTPQQIINFLQDLIDGDALPVDRLQKMGDTYKIATSKNTEITYRWLRLCIKSRDESKINEILQFVNSQGRMKYVRPIYRDLYAWEAMRQRAIDNFLENEQYMMHVSAYTLRKDLHLNE